MRDVSVSQKKRTEKASSDVAVKKEAKVLRKSLGIIVKKTGAVVHDAAYAEPKEANLDPSGSQSNL